MCALFCPVRGGAGLFWGWLWRLHQPGGLPLRREQHGGRDHRARGAGPAREGAAKEETLSTQPASLLLRFWAQGGAAWQEGGARLWHLWKVRFKRNWLIDRKINRSNYPKLQKILVSLTVVALGGLSGKKERKNELMDCANTFISFPIMGILRIQMSHWKATTICVQDSASLTCNLGDCKDFLQRTF